MKTMVLTFIAGSLFGAGLAISGMTDPKRVVDFLDITGAWDPTLMFVMGGALLVFFLGRMVLRKKKPIFSGYTDPVSKPLIVGAILFGIGWGIGGFCPGPGLASLGGLRTEALIFVPAMAIGMIVAQRIFKLDQ